jgi:hypothetical protein
MGHVHLAGAVVCWLTLARTAVLHVPPGKVNEEERKVNYLSRGP